MSGDSINDPQDPLSEQWPQQQQQQQHRQWTERWTQQQQQQRQQRPPVLEKSYINFVPNRSRQQSSSSASTYSSSPKSSSIKKQTYSIEENSIAEGEIGEIDDTFYAYSDLNSEVCVEDINNNHQNNDNHQNHDSDPLKIEFRSLADHKRPSPIFAIITLFLLILGQAISTTSHVDAIFLLICRHFGSGGSDGGFQDPRCRQSDVAAAVATFAAYRGVVSGIIGTIVSPKLCALSDRIGRRVLLIYTGVIIGFADLIMLLCCQYPDYMDYKWTLVSAVLTGLSGTTLAGCLYASYFVDCIKITVRPKYLAWVDASVNTGLALGPGLGSMVLQNYNSLTLVLGITFIVDLVYTGTVYIFVPESRTVKARRQSQTAYTSSLVERQGHSLRQQYLNAINVFSALGQLKFSHITNSRDTINAWLLVAALTVPTTLGLGLSQLFVMYPETVFKWSSVETGYLLSMMGTIKSLSLAFLFPSVYRILEFFWHVRANRLDKLDTLLIRVGITGYTIGYCGVAMARRGEIFTAGIATADVFVGIWTPAIKNGIVKYASKDDVGEVFGALGMLSQIASIFSPFLFLTVFNKTLAFRPSIVFEMAATALLCLSILTFFLTPSRHPYTTPKDDIINQVLTENDSLLPRGVIEYDAVDDDQED